jgi:RNA-splicing ligase RtcB
VGRGLKCLRSGKDIGAAYLLDAGLARRFVEANRREIACLVDDVVFGTTGVGHLNWAEAITTDHNHVEHETHGSHRLWVHRKGAMPALFGQSGVPSRFDGKPQLSRYRTRLCRRALLERSRCRKNHEPD